MKKSEDLISREAVLKRIEEAKESGNANYGTLLDIERWVRYGAGCAYDVEDVIGQLKQRGAYYDGKIEEVLEGKAKDVGYYRDVKAYADAVDIVESGWTVQGAEAVHGAAKEVESFICEEAIKLKKKFVEEQLEMRGYKDPEVETVKSDFIEVYFVPDEVCGPDVQYYVAPVATGEILFGFTRQIDFPLGSSEVRIAFNLLEPGIISDYVRDTVRTMAKGIRETRE